jgi:esterase/lipase superfamily enzyme
VTLFLNCRTAAVGGDVVSDPYVLEGDGLVDPIALRTLGWEIPPPRVAGREVVFATHGFNVSYAGGVHSLAGLERDLALPPRFVFVGVLWPGDYWIPAVNYPAEAADAVRCGRLLARFVNRTLGVAAGVSFVSHSLGGRLILEAVKHLERPAREVCLAAAAVDDDCLARAQYDDARRNAARVSVLASTKDLVLRLAYPVGDFLSDVFYDDDSPWHAALGYRGPRPAALEHVAPAQIPAGDAYGHGDYFPAGTSPTDPKTQRAVTFVAESLLGVPHGWP